jgi:hypothetical protein
MWAPHAPGLTLTGERLGASAPFSLCATVLRSDFFLFYVAAGLAYAGLPLSRAWARRGFWSILEALWGFP